MDIMDMWKEIEQYKERAGHYEWEDRFFDILKKVESGEYTYSDMKKDNDVWNPSVWFLNSDSMDDSGRTALSILCGIKDERRTFGTDMVEYFLKKGMDPNVPDKEGETPILRALYAGRMDVLKVLVDAGADFLYKPPASHRNSYGLSALEYATFNNEDASGIIMSSGKTKRTDVRKELEGYYVQTERNLEYLGIKINSEEQHEDKQQADERSALNIDIENYENSLKELDIDRIGRSFADALKSGGGVKIELNVNIIHSQLGRGAGEKFIIETIRKTKEINPKSVPSLLNALENKKMSKALDCLAPRRLGVARTDKDKNYAPHK